MKPDELAAPVESPSKLPFSQIRKRDGRTVPFDAGKITIAILKAGRATGEFGKETADALMLRVLILAQSLSSTGIPTVEGIQDLVEEVLITSPFRKTAKAYILYRDQHARMREIAENADLDLVDGYLDERVWQVRECSNSDYSLQGLNNYISGKISQVYWLKKIYSPEIRDAHLSGAIHVHDLTQLSIYCMGWDFRDLLLSGFQGVPGKAESRPARHFRSALGQIVNFFYTLQGEAAGAQAFSNFDTLLVPFIRWDGLGYAEVKQALQEFTFNLNVPTRVGFQTPFTNLTLDLQPPAILANDRVIIGGQLRNETFAEFAAEMALLNRAFVDVLGEGDAKGRVFTFPIPTLNVTRNFDWDNPALEKLWALEAKYGTFYIANFANSEMSPDTMRGPCAADCGWICERCNAEVEASLGPTL